MFLNIFFFEKNPHGGPASLDRNPPFYETLRCTASLSPGLGCVCVLYKIGNRGWKPLKDFLRCFFFHYQREALVQQVFSKSRHCQNLPQWFIFPSSSPGFSLPTYSPSITSHKSMSCCCGASTVAILCSTVGTLSSTVTILCSTVAILCSTVAILCSTVAI